MPVNTAQYGEQPIHQQQPNIMFLIIYPHESLMCLKKTLKLLGSCKYKWYALYALKQDAAEVVYSTWVMLFR